MTACFCTDSIKLILVNVCGDHITFANSKFERTNEEYNIAVLMLLYVIEFSPIPLLRCKWKQKKK